MLRLWQAGNGDTPEWRIVIEDVRTQERQSFASVDHLAAFLHTLIHGQATGGAAPTDREAADGESA